MPFKTVISSNIILNCPRMGHFLVLTGHGYQNSYQQLLTMINSVYKTSEIANVKYSCVQLQNIWTCVNIVYYEVCILDTKWRRNYPLRFFLSKLVKIGLSFRFKSTTSTDSLFANLAPTFCNIRAESASTTRAGSSSSSARSWGSSSSIRYVSASNGCECHISIFRSFFHSSFCQNNNKTRFNFSFFV